MVPWLHTVTEAVNSCPGVTLGGPLTAWIAKSEWKPTPMGLLARELLVSRNSSS